MCGFIVQIECGESILGEKPEDSFRRIQGDLSIRGPDEQNFFARDNVFLAHARLSIIDVKSGQQPMTSPETDRTVVFNGEIYNFKELKSKENNFNFRSQSDTELLLTLEDLENPQKFLDSLKGMFSFCLVDFRRKKMLVARDRFGKKPLFCGKIGNRLFASSRLKTIKNYLAPYEPPTSAFGLGYFVDFGFIPAPFSMIEGIDKLLPGEWRVFNLDGRECKRGFIQPRMLPNSIEYSKSKHLTEEIFEDLMRNSIQTRLNSERPIGLLLSDGVDSSIVARLLADLERIGKSDSIKAIILSSDDQFDESKGAVAFSKKIGLDYEVVRMESYEENIQETLSIMDEPFADLSIFPTYAAFKALKKFATVALTGDGGDELFGGYPYQYQNRFLCNAFGFSSHYGILRRLKLLKDLPHAFSKPAYLYRRLSNSGLFHSYLYEKYTQKIPDSRQRFEALVSARSDFSISGNVAHSQWNNSASLGLSDRMLAKVDLCSMGAGVEARSPFLDDDLWDFIMRSDATQFDHRNSECKLFLKSYLKPFKTLGTKRGFSMDYTRLTSLQHYPRSNPLISRFLSDSTSAEIADKIVSLW